MPLALREVLRAHLVADVVALPVAVGAAEEDAAADDVAAVLRNHVRAQPARLNLRRMRAGADRHFGAQRVVDVALLVRGFLAVHAHAVDVLHGVLRRDAVAARVGLLHLARPAHVGRAETNARHHHADRHDVARRRQRVDEVARQHLRACRLRHVDQRCLSGHRDRLFERADLEIGVRGHRDAAGHFEALAHDGVEAGQRKRDAVDAGTQIDDVEAPLIVGDGRSHFFDQHRARRLDRDAGQHAARFVAHDAVNLTLRRRTFGQAGARRRAVPAENRQGSAP